MIRLLQSTECDHVALQESCLSSDKANSYFTAIDGVGRLRMTQSSCTCDASKSRRQMQETLRFEFTAESNSKFKTRDTGGKRRCSPFAAISVPQPKDSCPTQWHILPVCQLQGHQRRQYVWDGKRVRAVNDAVFVSPDQPMERLLSMVMSVKDNLKSAFFPSALDVTADYWEYARWRACHRLFSSMSSIFATQSMLIAVGIGAQRTLPAAAAINWVLKDGLGRLGRLSVATRFGRSFDSDLKRFRFATSVLYCCCTALEYLTPLAPSRFLLLASVANIGKSIGLTTFIATEPAFQKSFCRSENIADVSAKTQAQQMVLDTVGLALAVTLTRMASGSSRAATRLPFVLFPILTFGDLFSIYHELKSIQLRTLNTERAEIVVHQWLRSGTAPTPQEASHLETLLRQPTLQRGALPLKICPLDAAVDTPQQLDGLLQHYRNLKYMLALRTPPPPSIAQKLLGGTTPADKPWLAVTLRDDVTPRDTVQAVLQAGYLRKALCEGPLGHQSCTPMPDCGSTNRLGGRTTDGCDSGVREGGVGGQLSSCEVDALVTESRNFAKRNVDKLLADLLGQGWQTQPFLLSKSEAISYVL